MKKFYSWLLLGACLYVLCKTDIGKIGRVQFVRFASLFYDTTSCAQSSVAEDLQRDYHRLCEQMEQVRSWLLQEERIEALYMRYQTLLQADDMQFLRRRQQYIAELLCMELHSLPAKVIYREPCFWSSFLWINVGTHDNQRLGRIIVAKNSPVVVGNALVGIIEEVELCRAKVRLLSDAQLVPSVRVMRGQEMLAKGELHGSSLPLWRSRGQILIGLGFNYDTQDEEGHARILRHNPPLIQEGDLLITSGLDGLFPKGLDVAYVTEIELLHEGETSYEIKARAVAQFDTLKDLVVLPPI